MALAALALAALAALALARGAACAASAASTTASASAAAAASERRAALAAPPLVLFAGGAVSPAHAPEYVDDARYHAHAKRHADDTAHMYVVQLREPLALNRDALAADCALPANAFVGYFPHHSFVLVAPERDAECARAHRHSTWVGAFLPEHKVALALGGDARHDDEAVRRLGQTPHVLLLRFNNYEQCDNARWASPADYAAELARRLRADAPELLGGGGGGGGGGGEPDAAAVTFHTLRGGADADGGLAAVPTAHSEADRHLTVRIGVPGVVGADALFAARRAADARHGPNYDDEEDRTRLALADADARRALMAHARRVARWLASQPEAAWVEPVAEWRPHLTTARGVTLRGVAAGVGNTAPLATTGAAVVVGIGDQGFDANCAELSMKSVGPPAGGGAAHGTAMAAACCGAASGVATGALVRGVPLGFSGTDPADVGGALRGALDGEPTTRAHIVVTGAGAAATQYSAVSAAADAALYELEHDSTKKGVLAVVSAGNNAAQLSSLAYAKNPLAVGATLNGANAVRASAAYPIGPTRDGRFKPDVLAIGEGVALPCGVNVQNAATSLAAASAAGAAATVRSYLAEGYYPRGFPIDSVGREASASLVKAMLAHATVPVDAVARSGSVLSGGGARTPNGVQGFGRLRLDQVLRFCQDEAGTNCDESAGFSALFLEDGVQTRALDPSIDPKDRICLSVAPGSRYVKVTLAWMDAAAMPGAGHALVNDLDLALVHMQSGAEFRGNNGDRFDRENTVEQVHVLNPPPGAYAIVIGGTRVTVRQGWAVVATGNLTSGDCTAAEFQRCPLDCSGRGGGACNAGVCQCETGVQPPRVGLDCSLRRCDEQTMTCTPNGYCDYVLQKCQCAPGFGGRKCESNFGVGNEPIIMEVIKDEVTNIGVPTNTFVGYMVGVFLAGCCLALICGPFVATRYLTMQRNRRAADGN